MLDVLAQLEQALPAMLMDESIWQSLYVDYHPPIVERLWTRWREYRASCTESILASASRLCSTLILGPPLCASSTGNTRWQSVLVQGCLSRPSPLSWFRGDFRYEMTHPDSWHYVRPLGAPTLSLMVTGKPWDRESHKSGKPLQPLRTEQVAELLRLFRARYPLVLK